MCGQADLTAAAAFGSKAARLWQLSRFTPLLLLQAMQEQMTKKIGSLEASKAELTKKLEEKEVEVVKLRGEKEHLKRMTDMEACPSVCLPLLKPPAAASTLSATRRSRQSNAAGSAV